MTHWMRDCGLIGLAVVLLLSAVLQQQVVADQKLMDTQKLTDTQKQTQTRDDRFSGQRSTPASMAFTPVDEDQLGQAALQGLPRETVLEAGFVKILVEPVMYSESFKAEENRDRELIRYQQLLLLVQDQGRQQRLRQQQQIPMLRVLQFRQDGRQYSPESAIRTLPP